MIRFDFCCCFKYDESMIKGVSKKFKYGDLHMTDPMKKLDKLGSGRQEIDIERLTKNHIFRNFLKENGYKLYLDFEYKGFAATYPTRREIVLNGNFSDATLSAFLQHEMGHLVLFNVNQFTTVSQKTLRSIIAEVLYISENLITYGMPQLLQCENIIQDIIIETLSDGRCVCSAVMSETMLPAGVKHLEILESTKRIAQETAKNVLKPLNKDKSNKQNGEFGEDSDDGMTLEELRQLEEILKRMIEDLQNDIQESKNALNDLKKSDRFQNEVNNRREIEKNKLSKQKQDLQKKIDKLNQLGKPVSDKLKELLDKVSKDLQQNMSSERTQQDKQSAQESKDRAVDNLSDKIESQEQLLEDLLKQLEDLQKAVEEAEANAQNGDDGDSSSFGNGDGDTQDEMNSHSKDDKLHKNNSDHLLDKDAGLDDENNPNTGHSYDCGLPYPVSINRDESKKYEAMVLQVGSTKRRLTSHNVLEIDQDQVIDHHSRNKSLDKEHTYFRPNKKEYDETDMLKGHRRQRVSGINVLIGLDVSGSMTMAWTSLFGEIIKKIQDLQNHLDIEKVVYFTYNHQLQEVSEDLSDLRLSARGGNAFGYVYEQICRDVQMLNKNEIILITDCGDNLGFQLDSVVKVMRNNQPVTTHVTVVDTESAGFYRKENFDENDWSLFNYGDINLFEQIQENLDNLIQR